MNVKDHIEAGHYPKSNGEWPILVLTRGGNTAYIYTTRHHPDWPIVGGIEGESEPFAWRSNGRITRATGDGRDYEHDDPRDLLPPPPRKVKVTRYAVMISVPDNKCHATFAQRNMAEQEAAHMRDGAVVIELTGEYEERW
jgi:hypothetical protein